MLMTLQLPGPFAKSAQIFVGAKKNDDDVGFRFQAQKTDTSQSWFQKVICVGWDW